MRRHGWKLERLSLPWNALSKQVNSIAIRTRLKSHRLRKSQTGALKVVNTTVRPLVNEKSPVHLNQLIRLQRWKAMRAPSNKRQIKSAYLWVILMPVKKVHRHPLWQAPSHSANHWVSHASDRNSYHSIHSDFWHRNWMVSWKNASKRHSNSLLLKKNWNARSCSKSVQRRLKKTKRERDNSRYRSNSSEDALKSAELRSILTASTRHDARRAQPRLGGLLLTTSWVQVFVENPVIRRFK